MMLGPPKIEDFSTKDEYLRAVKVYVQELADFMSSYGASRDEIVKAMSQIPGVVIVKKNE